jgi:ABC-type antimicrobial peptide transport system permease subunit
VPAFDAKTRAGIKRQIQLPNREAIKIAVRSLRIRKWRSAVTLGGIILTIAFLSAVTTSGIVAKAVQATGQQVSVDAASGKATQIWLIMISLLVCAVGIANAMLMSVTERYREIGTMKCLGALDWFVVKLFLIEAAFLGIVGSIVGALLGFAASFFAWVAQYGNIVGELPWGQLSLRLLAAVLIGTALSVVGAIYPARRAGRMPPADAMRSEL